MPQLSARSSLLDPERDLSAEEVFHNEIPIMFLFYYYCYYYKVFLKKGISAKRYWIWVTHEFFRINNHYHLTLWCIFNRTHNYICQEFTNSLQENNVHTFFWLAITTIYLFLSEIAGMLHSTVQPKLRSLTDSLPEQEEEGPEFISLLTDLPDLANHQNFLCRK